MLRRSDVNKRLPRFREALASIEQIRKQGGLETVPQPVIDRLESLEPIGLSRKGQLVLPKSYDHIQQPPVVMLLPGEVGRRVHYAASESAVRAANFVLDLLNAEVAPDMLSGTNRIPDSDVWVNHTPLVVNRPGTEGCEIEMPIPRLIYVSAGVPSDMLGTALAHETDHWDFFYDLGPRLQSRPERSLTPGQLAAATEKRAYDVAYQIEHDMGSYKPLGSIDALIEGYAGTEPVDARNMYDDLIKRRKAAGIERKISAPLAAVAIQQLFGQPGEIVTNDEVVALVATGLA